MTQAKPQAGRSAEDAVAALLAARESWLDLGAGRRLRVRRPAEHQLPELRRADATAYCATVVAWEGFTTRDVWPDDAGSDPLPCDRELVRELLGDRAEWLAALVDHVVAQVVRHVAAAEERRKNSAPS